MAKETKFTKEELEQLEAIKNQYDTITVQLGQLELEQIASFQELRKQETTLANTFTEKYGKGQLNLKTGVFVSEE